MARLESPNRSKTVTFTCDPELADELSELADEQDVSRAELLRQLSADAVDGEDTDTNPTHEPTNDTLREVYNAALETSNDKLILNMRKHSSRVAQLSRISKDTLHSYLKELEAKGYAVEQSAAPGGTQPQTAWRIKPKCATVQHWKYRKR